MAVPSFLHPFAPAGRTDFVSVVRGEGATVWDADGRPYVDALAGLWYCQVGHGRAVIADRVASQLRQLGGFHAFDRFTNPAADELADRLADLAPMPGARVFLTSSGSEAVDTALKLARLAHAWAGAPERTVVISRRQGYHGVTYGGVSVQGLPLNQQGYGPLLPDVVTVPHDDLAALEAAAEEAGGRLAAVIAEPVIGAGGVIPPADGYLAGLRRVCDAAGALLILDEVICGFGRLGTWWGAQRYAVRPDLVVFAKGVTSGYLPLGGVLVGPAVRASLEAAPERILRHGHTYSGHPAASVAALANLDVLTGEGLLDRVPHLAARLGGGLGELVADGRLGGCRGAGAIWAAQLPDGCPAPAVHAALLARGVIARPLGDGVVAFCPPLVIDDAGLDRCLTALTESLDAVRP